MSDLRGRLWQYFGELLSQREYEAIESIAEEVWAGRAVQEPPTAADGHCSTCVCIPEEVQE